MKAKPPFLCLKPGFDLALGKVLLTGVGTAPSSETDMYFQYKKLSLLKEVEKCFRKMIQGALTSRPASTMLSAKLRHGLARHPSSLFLMDESIYKSFAQK